eukprot:1541008-Pleurochrysis_carterae.AAC.1
MLVSSAGNAERVLHDAGRWSRLWRRGVRRSTLPRNVRGYRLWWNGNVNGRLWMRLRGGGRE